LTDYERFDAFDIWVNTPLGHTPSHEPNIQSTDLLCEKNILFDVIFNFICLGFSDFPFKEVRQESNGLIQHPVQCCMLPP